MERQSYFFIFSVLVLVAVLHIFGVRFYLYWDFWWYDVLLHFLGGVWVATTAFWVYYHSGWFATPKIQAGRFLCITLVSSLAVGLVWELFEYLTGLTFVLPGIDYKIDTLCDLGMDLVGGLASYLYYRLHYWKLFV